MINLLQEKHRIRIAEVSPNGEITLPALMNYLQELAWNHSLLAGVSIYTLLEMNLSWVLSRLRMELYALPKHTDTVEVSTWISEIDKYFHHREFEVHAADGTLLAKAKSLWGVLDIEKRRVIPDVAVVRKQEWLNTERTAMPLSSFGKFTAWNTPDFVRETPVRWHDIDMNAHVNNTCYFQWAIETFSPEFLEKNRLKMIDISFRNESRWGDTILGQAQYHEGQYLQKLLNQEGKELILARSVWE